MLSIPSINLERFDADDDGRPVVMLNLVRFRPNGGREQYLRYLAMAAPVAARYGAEIVFAGDAGFALAAEDGQTWDAVALVRYPTRHAFLMMIEDPDYRLSDPLRISALKEAVLQPVASMS